MIAILDNIISSLISSLMLPLGFAFDNLVFLLKAPFGFLAVFSSITFFEYSTAKSIAKDFKKTKSKKPPLICSDDKVLIASCIS